MELIWNRPTELLHDACFESKTPTVGFLLDRGGNTEARNLKEDTPLASFSTIVELLAGWVGADVEVRNDTSNSLLHIACRKYSRWHIDEMFEMNPLLLDCSMQYSESIVDCSRFHVGTSIQQYLNQLSISLQANIVQLSPVIVVHCFRISTIINPKLINVENRSLTGQMLHRQVACHAFPLEFNHHQVLRLLACCCVH